MFDEDFPSWRRRRRPLFFPKDIDEYFEEMDRYFEEIFKDMETRIPRNLIKERDLPSGGKLRELGPFVYGYSVTVGPDGKPVIREFGNIKPTIRGKEPVELSDKREPLIDILDEKDIVRVIAELPGVEKEDINLAIEGKKLSISVDAARKYFRTVEIPSAVDVESIKAIYKNGILEVTLKKPKTTLPKGKKINIE